MFQRYLNGQKVPLYALFLDMRKAFDTVDIESLSSNS